MGEQVGKSERDGRRLTGELGRAGGLLAGRYGGCVCRHIDVRLWIYTSVDWYLEGMGVERHKVEGRGLRRLCGGFVVLGCVQ